MKLKVLTIFICFAVLLCGCSNNVAKTSSVIPIQSSTITSTVDFSAPPYLVQNYSGENDQLLHIFDHDKTLMFYGELSDEKYQSAFLELEAVLNGYSRDISVVCYSLNNKKAISYNTNARMFCACTVKAAFNLFACKEMDNGVGSLDTVMTYQEKHYEPGTGDMQYSSYGTQFNMKTILHKSMSISDNVGYLMSVDYFGREKYNTFIENLGCSSLKIKPTVWALKASAKDLAIIWREIYKYVNSDAMHAEFFYNSCTNTPDNYATLALGDKYTISHKQGHNNTAAWPSYSDAGIVWKGNDSYIVAIITNSLGPNAESRKVMADAIKIIDEKLF